MAPMGAFWCPFLIKNPNNDRFSDKERRGHESDTWWMVGSMIDRRAGRPAGQFAVHSHGRELFSSDTSSYTRAHPIDFVNPDSHLLGKNMLDIASPLRGDFSEEGNTFKWYTSFIFFSSSLRGDVEKIDHSHRRKIRSHGTTSWHHLLTAMLRKFVIFR